MASRNLRLTKETLAELSTAELRDVVGATATNDPACAQISAFLRACVVVDLSDDAGCRATCGSTCTGTSTQTSSTC
jgi:thymidine phosphorylase